MLLVCAQCHQVVGETEPLLIPETKLTVCDRCQREAMLRYINMLNELYFEEQTILKTGTDKS